MVLSSGKFHRGDVVVMRWSCVENDLVDVDVEWIKCEWCGFRNTVDDQCDCESDDD